MLVTHRCRLRVGVFRNLVSEASSKSASLSSYSCAQCLSIETVKRSVFRHSRNKTGRNKSAVGLERNNQEIIHLN